MNIKVDPQYSKPPWTAQGQQAQPHNPQARTAVQRCNWWLLAMLSPELIWCLQFFPNVHDVQNMKVFWYLKMFKSGFFTFVSFSSLVIVLTSGITPLSRSKATFNCFILSLSFAFAVFLRYFVIRAARELKVFWPFWGKVVSFLGFPFSCEMWLWMRPIPLKKGPLSIDHFKVQLWPLQWIEESTVQLFSST